MKNSLDNLDSLFNTTKEKINGFKDRTIETIQFEAERENKVKIMKKTSVTSETILNCPAYM